MFNLAAQVIHAAPGNKVKSLLLDCLADPYLNSSVILINYHKSFEQETFYSPDEYLLLNQVAEALGDSIDGFYFQYFFCNLGLEEKQAAFAEVKRIAEKGESKWAQYVLAFFYANGYGVEPNLKKRSQLLEKLVDQDYPMAQFELGLEYYQNNNLEAAQPLFKQAAAAGVKPAHPAWCETSYKLALQKQETDLQAAVLLAQEAAHGGFPPAQFLLGAYYEISLKEKKLEEAFSWYQKAATRGHAEALNALGSFYSNGKGNVKQSYKKALICFEKAAAQKCASALYNLGNLYKAGLGVEKNLGKSFTLFEESAQQGFRLAYIEMGLFYLIPLGHFEKDGKKAFEWFKKAHEAGLERGTYYLAGCYYDGLGVKQDLQQAQTYFEESASKGDAQAQTMLGRIYQTKGNDALAISWFKKAAAQDCVEALQHLMEYMPTGTGQETRRSYTNVRNNQAGTPSTVVEAQDPQVEFASSRRAGHP